MIGRDKLREAGFIQRQAARLHLLMCRHCRTYARQIRAIGYAARALWKDAHPEPQQIDRIFARLFEKEI
jgi:hypothetical protein